MTCRDCKWFESFGTTLNGSQHGVCRAPIPSWVTVEDLDNAVNERFGKDCPCFKTTDQQGEVGK